MNFATWLGSFFHGSFLVIDFFSDTRTSLYICLLFEFWKGVSFFLCRLFGRGLKANWTRLRRFFIKSWSYVGYLLGNFLHTWGIKITYLVSENSEFFFSENDEYWNISKRS